MLSIEAGYHRSSGGCESSSHRLLGHICQQILQKYNSFFTKKPRSGSGILNKFSLRYCFLINTLCIFSSYGIRVVFACFRIYSSVVRVYLLNKRDANCCDVSVMEFSVEFSVKMICSRFTVNPTESVPEVLDHASTSSPSSKTPEPNKGPLLKEMKTFLHSSFGNSVDKPVHSLQL